MCYTVLRIEIEESSANRWAFVFLGPLTPMFLSAYEHRRCAGGHSNHPTTSKLLRTRLPSVASTLHCHKRQLSAVRSEMLDHSGFDRELPESERAEC